MSNEQVLESRISGKAIGIVFSGRPPSSGPWKSWTDLSVRRAHLALGFEEFSFFII
jgi:hypothetical protein